MLLKFIAVAIGLPIMGCSLTITIALIRYGFQMNIGTSDDRYDQLDADYEEYLKKRRRKQV
ncbi:hypothetical protein [Enterococcus faecalis]|uniref:hypothetical protein n=2 Tax=Enterococcus faecalis TaxID=1351 RepID=UPI0021C78FC2|nr:hypothetical protein [Enterococcus faecalis]MCU2247620.1 hypothetical protein [Enterococcus faecalis]MDN3167016.1 hypothetical protein [Enterococcus faecalis]MEE3741572.1 hypothetical protein [Enterococcus faecalis]